MGTGRGLGFEEGEGRPTLPLPPPLATEAEAEAGVAVGVPSPSSSSESEWTTSFRRPIFVEGNSIFGGGLSGEGKGGRVWGVLVGFPPKFGIGGGEGRKTLRMTGGSSCQ